MRATERRMKMTDFKAAFYESGLLDERYRKFTHPSGLDIYVFPKKMSAKYALFGTKYGSVNNSFCVDGSDQVITVPDGIAHFLEHKLFFNEDGSDSFERFSDYGADANAYTSFNKTAYLFSCTDNFDKSLTELIDFVTHPYFTPESVASEIGIISEEIKMYDDSPGDRCFYGMLEGMYKSHSIRRNICGTEESISRITAPMLYDCYRAFYRPDNMMLIVCGDVSAEEVLTIAGERLENFKNPSKQVKFINENSLEAPSAYKPYTEQRMQVAKPIFNIGFKDTDISDDPRERQRKDAVMSILDEMLFSRAGELYNSLFDKKLISPSMSYGYTMSQTFAYHSVAGESDDPRAVLDEIMAYIGRVRGEGLDKKDFERAKKVMYAEAVKCFDSVENIANSLFTFVCEGAEIFECAEIIGSIGFDEVEAAFKQAFDASTVTLSVVSPITNN